ncbi:MAG: glutamate-5-semialdehyde dehydrogenase [Chloroflexota bacterium]|nr:glutamate-5-semialdehyde dehydrogenase [Chloroflexota bacterium]
MATAIAPQLESKGRAARAAAPALARTPSGVKDRALLSVADALEAQADRIIEANARDLEAGREGGLSSALMDRLLLDVKRIGGMAAGVREIAALPDPVGQEIERHTRPDGLVVTRRRTPLGVVGVIYESRPNVTVDIAALCFKAGDPCILRGGKEAIHSNTVLAAIIRDAIAAAGGPAEAVQVVEDTDRALVLQMLGMTEYIDLIVPRGSSSLVNFVAENAQMPAITGGIGVCHTYVDAAAETETAVAVTTNAKVRRPSVCNALDTVLVHSQAAPRVLPLLAGTLSEAGVEMRCDRRSATLLASRPGANVVPAAEDDFGQEFLDLICSVKVVDSMDEALEHIARYGSGHSEAIITEDAEAAERFLDEVDAAAVFVNASTGFNDGFEFGLGAELAISTNKFHARGPMGLRELTSYKWVVLGKGHTRP